jgi:hypothetical protein
MYQELQQARQKAALLTAHLLDCWPEDLAFRDGKIQHEKNPEQTITLHPGPGTAHHDTKCSQHLHNIASS